MTSSMNLTKAQIFPNIEQNILEASVADLSQKWKENKAGKMFVDQSCIACDACVLTAPKNFSMHEDDGHAYVAKQPETPDEVAACKEAMEGCPVEAIGDFGDEA